MRCVFDHDRRGYLYRQPKSELRLKIQTLVLRVSFLFLSFLFFSFFPSSSYAIGSIGVKPLRIDLELSANKRGEFEIEVYSTSREDTPIHLSLFDARQKEDGTLEFVDIGENPYSCTQWIKLEKEDYIVPVGESVFVKGEITVPRMARAGSRLATIMVEPDYEKKKTGLSIRVRYAVVLRLRIMGRSVLEEAKIEKFGITKLSDGTPAVEAVFFNKSETDVQVTGSVLIQDSSRKIITRLDLITEALERKKKKEDEDKENARDRVFEDEEGQRVYPGARVAFLGKFDKPMLPGDYTAILNMKYGRRSIAAKEIITLSEEDLASLAKKSGDASFEIKPDNIEVNGQPGGMRTAFFTIINLTDKPAEATLSIKDIDYDIEGRAVIRDQGTTPYSASSWIHLNKSDCRIGPRLSQSISLKCRIPATAQPGGYYSQVVIEKPGGETGRSEKNCIEVGVILPGAVEPAVDIIRFEQSENEGSQSLVVDIKNNCAIHVIPKGRVIIKDIYNNEVEEVALTLNTRAILPQAEGRMTGERDKKLIPGEYTARAEIDYGGKEKATSKINLVIK